jgi:hypothetical protein
VTLTPQKPGGALPPQVFRFHDIAAVKVWSDSSFARAFFEAEYGYHRSAEVLLPQTTPKVFLDFRFVPHFFAGLDSAPPEGFTRHTHKLLAHWGYRLTTKPGEVNMRVYGNRMAVSMVHHMLVHPSLRWLAAGGGTLLLHAGAVAKNGKSLIFTGKGGAGKTTTTSLVLASDSGWQLHADDYVFLGGGQSKAYVTRSHLYRDLLKWVPEVGARLTPWERMRLEVLGAIRKYSGERLKWAVRLGPERLWPGKTIADSAIPAALLLLERAGVSAPELIPVTDLTGTTDDLLEMNFGEARHFLTLLQKTGALDEQWLSDWKDTERTLLAKLLTEIPAYRLVLPLSQSATEAKMALLPILDKLVE